MARIMPQFKAGETIDWNGQPFKVTAVMWFRRWIYDGYLLSRRPGGEQFAVGVWESDLLKGKQ